MARDRLLAAIGLGVLLALTFAAIPLRDSPALADEFTLKDGRVYRGDAEVDGVIYMVTDPLKRTFFRKTKIAKQTPNVEAGANAEEFKIGPEIVESGATPPLTMGLEAGPWGPDCQRTFSHVSVRTKKKIEMKQVIHILGPKVCEVRGIDHYWLAKHATTEFSKDLIISVLKQFREQDVKNEGNRKRIALFLLQSEWFDEALVELSEMVKDFPENSENHERAKSLVLNLRASKAVEESDQKLAAGQPKLALEMIKRLSTDGLTPEVQSQLSERVRKFQEVQVKDQETLDSIRSAFDQLDPKEQTRWRTAYLEAITTLSEIPDAIRDRFEPLRESQKAAPPAEPSQRFALALSGFLVGKSLAKPDLDRALRLWEARSLVRNYLRSSRESDQSQNLDLLQTKKDIDRETVTALAQCSAPPFHDGLVQPGKIRTIRAEGSLDNDPIEYAVTLPAEYHPLRRYPAIVALHSGKGPMDAMSFWEKDARQRGFILIAPEYRLPDKKPGYFYTQGEHAAVELSLRDARKRFAIDSDRVFLAGQLEGGNMAWDYGLAHPDEFAGIAIISGMPYKYVYAYKLNAELTSLYAALGGQMPGEQDFALDFSRKLIGSAVDMTYVDYPTRGQENLYGEAGPMVDWMTRRTRKAYPKEFKAVTARESDNRFYGVVIRKLLPDRAPDPAAVNELGTGLKPATIDYSTSAQSNLIRLNIQGVQQLDVWASPKVVDFSKKLEIRVNNKTQYKDLPPPDLKPLLEDLRIRGDREQIYWFKLTLGGARTG